MLILFKSDLRYRLEQNRKYILKIPTSDFPQKLSDNLEKESGKIEKLKNKKGLSDNFCGTVKKS